MFECALLLCTVFEFAAQCVCAAHSSSVPLVARHSTSGVLTGCGCVCASFAGGCTFSTDHLCFVCADVVLGAANSNMSASPFKPAPPFASSSSSAAAASPAASAAAAVPLTNHFSSVFFAAANAGSTSAAASAAAAVTPPLPPSLLRGWFRSVLSHYLPVVHTQHSAFASRELAQAVKCYEELKTRFEQYEAAVHAPGASNASAPPLTPSELSALFAQTLKAVQSCYLLSRSATENSSLEPWLF